MRQKDKFQNSNVDIQKVIKWLKTKVILIYENSESYELFLKIRYTLKI